VARALGLRPVPVPLDAAGIRADLLEAAFASSGARALYLQPAFSNPSGITLSPERRQDVLRLAERAGAFVIEDDYARDLGFGVAPHAPLFREGGDRVVYIRSLTKSTAPVCVWRASSPKGRCSAACALCVPPRTGSFRVCFRTPRSSWSTRPAGTRTCVCFGTRCASAAMSRYARWLGIGPPRA